MEKDIFNAIWTLRRECTSAFLSYVDEEGFPMVRAMLVLERETIAEQYFSTNTSSGKVRALRKNRKASVYYCDPGNYQGALFTGEIEVCTDEKTKRMLWREGFEMYYPKGVLDPDYCVLKLTVRRGSHYHGLCNTKFLPGELE